MDILLVLGSVTTKQYEPIRLSMLRAGMHPVVRRIRDHASSSSFFDELLEEDNEGDFDMLMQNATRAQDELLEGVLDDVYNIRFVRAFVLPADASAETDWTWVTKDIPREAAAYQVHRHDSTGEDYLVGVGFGSTLEIN